MNFTERLALCWRILRAKPGSLMAHAERELPAPDGQAMQARLNRWLRELVLVCGTHDHNGFRGSYVPGTLEKLLRHELLGPLTGEADEWVEVGRGVFQNRRCCRVFKQPDRFNGQAYDINSVAFRTSNGICYTNCESSRPVSFPYWPTTEYVDREAT